MNKDKILNGDKYINFNKKTTWLIVILIVVGIITGFLVSNYFLLDANQSIAKWNHGIDRWQEKWENSSWDNYSDWNNTGNDATSNQNCSNWTGFYRHLTPLTYNDVLLPFITIILLCISSYFLLALNVIYIKIFKNTKSKYIIGLIFVLIPLFIVSIFLIRVVKSLFFSSALKHSMINIYLGFGINSLGGMLSILSVFMIIGLGILLYLSNQ